MFRLLIDENFDHDIVRGLHLQCTDEIDVMLSRVAGLTGAKDSEVLAWAASEERILLTHDRKTIPRHAYQRLQNAESMPGVFVVPQSVPIGKAIDELVLILRCSQQSEWQNIVQFIPV